MCLLLRRLPKSLPVQSLSLATVFFRLVPQRHCAANDLTDFFHSHETRVSLNTQNLLADVPSATSVAGQASGAVIVVSAQFF